MWVGGGGGWWFACVGGGRGGGGGGWGGRVSRGAGASSSIIKHHASCTPRAAPSGNSAATKAAQGSPALLVARMQTTGGGRWWHAPSPRSSPKNGSNARLAASCHASNLHHPRCIPTADWPPRPSPATQAPQTSFSLLEARMETTWGLCWGMLLATSQQKNGSGAGLSSASRLRYRRSSLAEDGRRELEGTPQRDSTQTQTHKRNQTTTKRCQNHEMR